ncbi:uncharacterized protein LOC131933362, partial [Physella acuta]|uniref:uncharacterized protein LOC131933362 n=1 Tax=Physella acuta TaxID=109671 RepID=UPI0027DD92F1
NNPNQPDKFKPEPKEAKWGWALGVGIFSIIASIIALFVILDIVLFRKHCKFCQSNLRSFKKKIKKKLRNRKTKPYDQESKFPSQANMKPEKANSITTSLSDVSQSSAETVLTEVAL